jgi:hypothetical protein
MADDRDLEPGGLFSGIEEATGSSDDSDSEPLVTPEDRPRGILSATDREYLCGLKEYAQPQTDANRRQDIRERVFNGLKDFALLFLFLQREEREKIIEALGQDETEEAISSMAAFAYLALEQDQPRFEECLERGILMAANRDKLFRSAGRATDVDVSINVEYNPDPEKLVRQFEQGKNLTDAEIGVLVRNRKISEKDLEELQDEQRGFPGVFPGGRQS